jgi:hypothetical protein
MSSRPANARGTKAATLLLISCLIALSPLSRADQERVGHSTTAKEAVRLYDSGQYAEARALLEKLDAQGHADGKLLYRLFYCQRVAGDGKAMATLDRSVEKLEQEAEGAGDLESSFYLVNGYSSLNRPADAQRAARAATERIESGEMAKPATGLEQFRLGKLYADQRNSAEAEQWYRAAVASFSAEEETAHLPYLKWASRYLADVTYRREEFVDAEEHLARLTELDKPTMTDLDRLAVIRSRLGMYREAAQSWRAAELLDPANANRARYCYRLAEAAASLEELSAAAPDGRLWSEFSKDELESIMKATADQVRTIKEDSQKLGWTDREERAELQGRLEAAHPVFVAAALEYALQGNSIRQAAFFGGYAPLIFKAKEWRLPNPGSQ